MWKESTVKTMIASRDLPFWFRENQTLIPIQHKMDLNISDESGMITFVFSCPQDEFQTYFLRHGKRIKSINYEKPKARKKNVE